jgi:aryl-alcohol dehydrogenase-like predicted oxidoreductase
MQYRPLGTTGWNVSTISFGTWAMGSGWGSVDDRESMLALRHAVDLGVNFFDTADVYGDGHSEQLLARLCKETHGEIIVATKAGRRLNPHTASGYNRENLTRFVEDSLKNLGTDVIDLLQLHCPPSEVYDRAEVFAVLDDLTRQGKVRYYGVSVEKVSEALKALQYPNVQTVQIIFNVFRQKPISEFFARAQQRQVGILARVPLASGMLTGKFTLETAFAADDHRNYNRHGESFDQGETFSGVDYETGLQAVEELRRIAPPGMTLAQFALRWILMFDAVTCAIPGGKHATQVEENVRAADLPSLPRPLMETVAEIYDAHFRAVVEPRW